MESCRLCLKKSEFLITVLNDKDILDKIQKCVSVVIAVNDQLPKTVCTVCVEKVKNWFIFKQQCLQAQSTFASIATALDKPQTLAYQIKDTEKDNLKSIENSELDIKPLLHLEDSKPDTSENFYNCEICYKEYDNVLDYLNHQAEHNGNLVFKCDKCSKVFRCRSDLVDHEKSHKIPCPHCGKMILKTSLKQHLVKHTDRHKCQHCNTCFNSNSTLQQHIIAAHTNIKDYVCEICGKRFSSKTSMIVHLKSHSQSRSYTCKLCSYSGRTASALYVHMSTHENEVCICKICSKTFKSQRNLNDHLRRVHPKEKKHQCVYCNLNFVDKYMLTVHVRTHTGVRPYVCQICDKTFTRSDGLKEHKTVHEDRMMYDCDKCNKKFVSQKRVKRHHC